MKVVGDTTQHVNVPIMTLNPPWILALLLLPVISAKDAERKNITMINTDLYHQRDVLLQEVRALSLRHPESMLVQSWKSTVDDYSSEIVAATIEHGNSTATESKKYRILLSFGQHGRELITSEVALRLITILVGEKESIVFHNETIRTMLQKLIIKIIPLENYNGRKMVESGQLCERKNGRGVDINRNWSVDWGEKEEDFDPTEEYPGVAPFSEPETRIMRDLAKSFNPHLWINVHSGMQALFMPYDHKNALPDPTIVRPMKSLLEDLNHLHCNNSCMIGSGGGSVGYLAHGTATDYMYEVLEVPLAFTFEIFGDLAAPNEDCFRMFNPTTSVLYESIVNDWSMAFITIFVKLESVLLSMPVFLSTQHDSFLPEWELKFGKDFHFGSLVGAGEWNNDIQTLFEFIIIFSASYLAFIWYIYLRPWNRALQRSWTTWPCNFTLL